MRLRSWLISAWKAKVSASAIEAQKDNRRERTKKKIAEKRARKLHRANCRELKLVKVVKEGALYRNGNGRQTTGSGFFYLSLHYVFFFWMKRVTWEQTASFCFFSFAAEYRELSMKTVVGFCALECSFSLSHWREQRTPTTTVQFHTEKILV